MPPALGAGLPPLLWFLTLGGDRGISGQMKGQVPLIAHHEAIRRAAKAGGSQWEGGCHLLLELGFSPCFGFSL